MAASGWLTSCASGGRHLPHRRQAGDPCQLRPLRGLPFARGGELGKHVVEGRRHAADLVLAVVRHAQAVVLGLTHLGGDRLQALQRPNDVAMSEDGDDEAESGEGADQGEIQAHLAGEPVDAPLQEAVELGFGNPPGLQRIAHGGDLKAIGGGGVPGVDGKRAGIESAEVGVQARGHGGEGGVDGPPQTSIGIAAIGGLQIVFDLGRGGADKAGEDRQAGRVHIGRGRPLFEGGLQGGQLAEEGRQLAHDDVLDVVGVEIRIERQVGIIADAPGQGLRLGERIEQGRVSISPLRVARPEPVERGRRRPGEGGRLEGRAGLGLRSGKRAAGRLRRRAEPLEGLGIRRKGQDRLVGALQGREIAAAGKLLAGEFDCPLLLPHQPVDRRPQCEHEGAA
jgi:hypothetical protein